MVQFKSSILALVLMASAPLGGHSFLPAPAGRSATASLHSTSSSSLSSVSSVQLQASKSSNEDIGKQIVGGATAFITGLVFATRVAFADSSVLINNDFYVNTGKSKNNKSYI